MTVRLTDQPEGTSGASDEEVRQNGPTEAYIRYSFARFREDIDNLQGRVDGIDREHDLQIEDLKHKLIALEKRHIETSSFSQIFKNFLSKKLRRKHAYPRTRAKPTKTTRQP